MHTLCVSPSPLRKQNSKYKKTILSVVLYECETLFLALREGLWMFEKWMLGRICGPRRAEVEGSWR
jgi:hypothetical protein